MEMFTKILLLFFGLVQATFQSTIFDKFRVIDGNEARPHSRPYQVGLVIWKGQDWRETQHVCGGSVLSKNIILTSGFCLHESNRLQVVLGAHQLFINNEQTQQRFDLNSSSYIRHPDFSVGQMRNDIALLRLPRNAIFNSFVQPIQLPSSSFEMGNLIGEKVEVAGWGRFDDWLQDFSPVLRFTSNSIADTSFCSSTPMYRPLIHSESMCIETKSSMSSACRGDHGSAVTWRRDRNLKEIILAVYSYGTWWWRFGCSPKSGNLGIFSYVATDIRPYVKWIEENIKINEL